MWNSHRFALIFAWLEAIYTEGKRTMSVVDDLKVAVDRLVADFADLKANPPVNQAAIDAAVAKALADRDAADAALLSEVDASDPALAVAPSGPSA